MPRPFSPDEPDKETVQLRIMDAQVTLTRFVAYTFNSDFLTPSDEFSFTVADEDLPEKELAALQCGARVSLTINDVRVSDGHIDSIEISADRGGGTQYVIRGRDRLGLAVDSVADPTREYKQGSTLAEILIDLFTPFGWVNPEDPEESGTQAHYAIDNNANRAVSTGGDRGIKTTKKKGKPLKSFVLHQTKPHNHEGVFDFAKRMSERFGLWIWCSADGETLIVGKPDFDQEPLYYLRRNRDGSGNVEDGTVTFSLHDQPSVIIADGFSGGGEYGKGRIKAYAVNPYFGVDADGFVLEEVSAIVKKVPDAKEISLVTQPFTRRVPNIPIRPVYLHDDESKTPEQLEAYVRREMSLLMRKSLTVEYKVEGHGQYDDDGVFTAWAVDTVVDVQDQVAGVSERMYVLGVQFEKSRRGTYTKLHLIRLNSIQF